ncbi:3-deoxy-D-manno-octulosonic acid transferase [Mangrovimicrobium sediminis]|uniref:3-deoxy-D-manno-octulosonic acid transferase n=1 Tax=Mangrovimicrobium sediminis TaxID=2562682 RepID=A0A4Z0M096_9GAMM|nr:lipid IV(A) 3-deoxy-D-manno-octulosonic acid transferase [Haliea sp. SAOS-164]TGD72951.1 3-deoxy-D-manno-octulosonic acid transferase [Haliea sp. SAOS-164]
MRYLYSALLYLLVPVLLLRVLWRSRRAPAYRRRLAERFGLFPAPAPVPGPVIWVHAVSVGETLAAAPLVHALLQRHPGGRVVVTTTTPTGSARVADLFGASVFHVYLPWDLPGAVRRFLARLQPDLLILLETELWPNLLHYTHVSGCRIVLANARMSERSARGYGRLAGFTREVLGNLDALACQAQADAARLEALGAAPSRVSVTGSLKFDIDIDPVQREAAQRLQAALGRPVLLGASTHAGEEALLLDAFAAAREHEPALLLLLVPRHPERFDEVYRLCRERGWPVARRSAGEPLPADCAVLLGDTMGELRLFCGVASVCVVGGSFIPHGGQNPLEAAAWGVPLLCGPQMYNFSEITRLLTEAGAMRQLADPQQLAPALAELLGDAGLRAQVGRAGEAVVERNRGALARVLGLVDELLAQRRI